jgi:hypothetical protein
MAPFAAGASEAADRGTATEREQFEKADEFLMGGPARPSDIVEKAGVASDVGPGSREVRNDHRGLCHSEADGSSSSRKKKTTGVMRMISGAQIVSRTMLTPSKSKIPYSATPWLAGTNSSPPEPTRRQAGSRASGMWGGGGRETSGKCSTRRRCRERRRERRDA